MPGFAGRERRQFVRVSTNVTVRLHLGETVLTYPAAFARNISTGGLGIEVSGAFPGSYEQLAEYKDRLEVAIDIQDGPVIRAPAVVAWGHVGGKGDERRFEVGIRFLEIDGPDKVKLADFVKRKADEMLRAQAAERRRQEEAPPTGIR